MKKEIIIALVVGLTIGLIITLGISTANRALNTQKQKNVAKTNSGATLETNNHQVKKLNLTAPENFDLIDQPETIISGVAWPEAVISILAENQTFLIQADNEGVFTIPLKLIKGYNEITVIASDTDGTSQSANLVLTYSTSRVDLWKN